MSAAHYKISEEEFAEYTETFDLFNTNKDGFITVSELGRIFRSLGQNATESEIQDMIVKYDVDGNGKLDLDEFVKMMILMKQITNSEEELYMAFREFDKTGVGFITLYDFQELLQNLGEMFTDNHIAEMFREVDADSDGVLTYEEFLMIMK